MQEDIESIFNEHECSDYRWFNPSEVRVNNWVRFKCTWGCPNYGKWSSCPPNVPSIQECQQFLTEYSQGVIFHFEGSFTNREERQAWTSDINKRLLAIERDVFLRGFYKAFVLFIDPCHFCEECVTPRDACNQKLDARPDPDALGIDVYYAARSVGYPIQVLTDPEQIMNRYGFLLVE